VQVCESVAVVPLGLVMYVPAGMPAPETAQPVRFPSVVKLGEAADRAVPPLMVAVMTWE
jgi:hypothetical protein